MISNKSLLDLPSLSAVSTFTIYYISASISDCVLHHPQFIPPSPSSTSVSFGLVQHHSYTLSSLRFENNYDFSKEFKEIKSLEH